ncbi:HesB/IscA family protein [Brachybacterium tyrofermentans]|uniref:HesB/IscA family protein n=1 Tax=Brachybacterium tyrofermentans TaxID=47848 RepID=UPI003FD36ADA
MTSDSAALPPFTVTPAAIDEIAALGGAVRIDLDPGGCCGTAYAFTLPAAAVVPADGTMRYGCEGAWLLVSAEAEEVLKGATIDYRARTRPPRFSVLSNPTTTEVCPCRRSFGRPWPGRGEPTCRSYQPMPWDETFEPPAAWRRQTGWRPPSET